MKLFFRLQKSNLEGKLQVVRSSIRDVQQELEQPDYKNAEDDYRKNNVKLTVDKFLLQSTNLILIFISWRYKHHCVLSYKVISKSVEDLKLYEKAMDWAMIHFHKERMKMINDIVRDMWRYIYRGNDIDYIEIKTDEGTATASGQFIKVEGIYSPW